MNDSKTNRTEHGIYSVLCIKLQNIESNTNDHILCFSSELTTSVCLPNVVQTSISFGERWIEIVSHVTSSLGHYIISVMHQ